MFPINGIDEKGPLRGLRRSILGADKRIHPSIQRALIVVSAANS